ncbi:chaperonin cofactor prefoldin [Micromonospora vinacea]|uniref:Chaperonin cofactor prefoldin n=1 Tax=Micromonospora vinacea TaxID=709878 RepID=A0ABS0JX18_9ACTN|nr:PIN-like domain-containing protein [Micromonospora vinacea]MBG6100741.1 chaperonin cofactor prefoldin [Micromonospora vinacea]
MSGLSEGFEQYLVPDTDEIKAGITRGLVVLDSNVLLELYRFAAPARSELFEVLEKIGERIWIPHQVRVEFHRNRLKVMSSQEESYQEVLKAIGEVRQSQNSVVARIRELAKRVLLPEEARDELVQLVSRGLDDAERVMTQLRAAHSSPGGFAKDPILQRLQSLFEGRVGEPLDEGELSVAREEALRRVEAQEPPGYKDGGKEDPTGDYLVWYQTLKEAAMRNQPLLFVTRDAKEDWFLRLKGQTICGHPDLIAEARDVAGVPAIIMQTQSLLHHARAFLDTDVSEETIRQAESAAAQASRDASRTFLVKESLLETMTDIASRQAEDLRSESERLQRSIDRMVYELDARDQEGKIRDFRERRLSDLRSQAEEVAVELADLQAAVDMLRAKDYSTIRDSARLSWRGRPSRTRMLSLAKSAMRQVEMLQDWALRPSSPASEEATEVSVGAMRVGSRVSHDEHGEARVADIRQTNEENSEVQVELLLPDGTTTWVRFSELRVDGLPGLE